MKITLISPPLGEEGQKIGKYPIAPLVLEYMAGLTAHTAPDIEVSLIDANREDVNIDSFDADLVGFTASTVQAPWAYKTSDLLRSKGFKTVLGGIHVTALPHEAIEHTDTVVIGEAENIWKSLLNDFKNNKLKKFYRGQRDPLDNLPHPKTDLLKSTYQFRGFFTARGCPHHCIFCAVRKFFGDTVRHRPIGDVVNEVASSTQKFFYNADDNIWGIDINRSIELYRELSKNLHGKYCPSSAPLLLNFLILLPLRKKKRKAAKN